MSNTKIEDSIISAVEILTERAIDKAGFDKTIQATIKRCENKTAGQYVVKYQDSTFYAYASSPDVSYSNNTLVYVLIPQGDFKNNKTILGAVKKLGADYITMLNEDEAYDIIGQNIFASKDTFALKSYDTEPCIHDIDKETHLLLAEEYEGYIKESNYLQIKAKIKADISTDQSEGNYYLSIKAIFEDKAGGEVEREYRLGASQVVGSPYIISTPTTQSAIYAIDGENFKRFSTITLIKENFTVNTDHAVEDIWFSNIEINAVEPITFAGDGKLSLGILTKAGKVINNDLPSELTLEAIVKAKGAVYTNKVEYLWFVEDGKTATGDNYSFYAGFGWKRLNSATNILTVLSTDVVASAIRYRCVAIVDGVVLSKTVTLRNLSSQYKLEIVSDNGTEFFLDNGSFSLSEKLYHNGVIKENGYDTTWYAMDNHGVYSPVSSLVNIPVNTIEGFRRYYCIAYILDTVIASAELTVTNANQGGGYSIIIRNSDKVYKYDEKGISPCSNSRQKPMRIPELSFEVYDPEGKMCFDSATGLGGNKITWLLPANDSLIEPYDKDSAELDGDNYIYSTGTLEYKISNYYRATRTRKQIQLIVNYNGNVLTASTNFTFTKEGGNGTNGTAYTVVIREEDGGTNTSRTLYFDKYKDGEPTTDVFSSVTWSILKTKDQYSDINTISDGSKNKDKITISIKSWNSQSLDSADIIKLECKAPDGHYIYSYYPIVRYNGLNLDIVGGPGEILFKTDLSSCEYDDDIFEIKNLNILPNNAQIIWSVRPMDNDLNPSGVLGFNKDNIGDTFDVRVRSQYDGSTNNAVLCRAYDIDSGNIIAEKKIPIYIGVNRYSNAALNGWDGSSVQIDKEGQQYILAPQIGAGVKNEDNSFTGVIMGTQKSTSESDKIGLFGFGEGKQTFFVNAATGKLEARDADIEGKITATSGNIGNVKIEDGAISNGTNFKVDKNGNLTADNASFTNSSISGKIDVINGGTIGGFSITNDILQNTTGEGGIWIYPKASYADDGAYFPYGGIAVGVAGLGLIRLGAKKPDGKLGGCIVYGPTEINWFT